MPVEKRNIFLHETQHALPYVSKRKRSDASFPCRENPKAHAAFILQKLEACRQQDYDQKQVAAIRHKEGIYLEFSGAAGYDLLTKSFDNYSSGIRLLNVREDGQDDEKIVRATVYVPAEKTTYFLDKIQSYSESLDTLEAGQNPKNDSLVRSIEDVKLALLEAFWVGKVEDIPSDVPAWCEIWLRYEKSDHAAAEQDLSTCCEEFGIELNSKCIVFPERVVRLVRGTRTQLSMLLEGCNYLAEIRRAQEPTSFFDELTGSEQKEWVNDLLSRTEFHPSSASVCILDTGIMYSHPLLQPAIDENNVQAVNDQWGKNDHNGHGTEMAGVALYYDLKDKLSTSDTVDVYHHLESVKILPPHGENDPDLYGAVTGQAVSLAEISNPNANRSICMAVTSSQYNTNDGSPTSWSAAVDNISSGVGEEDAKRLFFISAGNVDPSEMHDSGYPNANEVHVVESPGQAWNALTVGAYTKDVCVDDENYRGFTPVADNGQLSPYSATSLMFSKKWPIKPEIFLNGGNMVTNGTDYDSCADLSLLTTGKNHLVRPFSTIWATSAATAQAAYMAAQIFAEYPDAWPETVRALLVHSARWTPQMEQQFCTDTRKSSGRRHLLRTCGYGVPDLERAIQCVDNSVNLIIQEEMQPYEKANGVPQMKEMHLHQIPWPSEVLQSLGTVEVEMRVTLSYFVEPGPGEKGWKDRYRYPSCGLRFDVINSNETIEDFKKRVNVKMRGDDKADSGDGSSGSERWFLGSDNRDVGSIHSDFIKATAAELSQAKYLAVYPVVGWWRERSYLGKVESKIRYSLIVSISTPDVSVDLYTPIVAQINNPIEVEIPTE